MILAVVATLALGSSSCKKNGDCRFFIAQLKHFASQN